MENSKTSNIMRSSRALIAGLVAVIVVLGLGLVAVIIGRTAAPSPAGESVPVNALAESDDECVVCHKRTTPGIV